MPIIAIVIGALLVSAGLRGKQTELYKLVVDDIAGRNSFLPWIGVFGLIYLLGKLGPLERVANAFAVLLIAVLLLTSGRGFFDQLTSQFNQLKDYRKPTT